MVNPNSQFAAILRGLRRGEELRKEHIRALHLFNIFTATAENNSKLLSEWECSIRDICIWSSAHAETVIGVLVIQLTFGRPSKMGGISHKILNQEFQHRSELKGKLRAILQEYEDEEDLNNQDRRFVMEVIRQTSHKVDLTNVQSIAVSKEEAFGTRCFFVKKEDGSSKSMSYVQCVDKIKSQLDIGQDRICHVLALLVKDNPLLSFCIFSQLYQNFPQKMWSVEEHKTYTRNSLNVASRCPRIRSNVLCMLVRKMVELDSAISAKNDQEFDVEVYKQWAEEQRQILAKQMEKAIHANTGSELLIELVAAHNDDDRMKKLFLASRVEEDSDPFAQKLDSMMCLVIEFLLLAFNETTSKVIKTKKLQGVSNLSSVNFRCSPLAEKMGYGLGGPLAISNAQDSKVIDAGLLDDLLIIFEDEILSAVSLKYVPFLFMFVFTRKQKWSEKFVDVYFQKVLTPTLSLSRRRRCLSVVGGFICSLLGCPESWVVKSASLLIDYMTQSVNLYDVSGLSVDSLSAAHHQQFAMFYSCFEAFCHIFINHAGWMWQQKEYQTPIWESIVRGPSSIISIINHSLNPLLHSAQGAAIMSFVKIFRCFGVDVAPVQTKFKQYLDEISFLEKLEKVSDKKEIESDETGPLKWPFENILLRHSSKYFKELHRSNEDPEVEFLKAIGMTQENIEEELKDPNNEYEDDVDEELYRNYVRDDCSTGSTVHSSGDSASSPIRKKKRKKK
eukprot:GHVL01030812.1.p1 GENE.GHVL01030812.1~~GHVL01030812.1.p1  ORF type:complete len:730 (-),score=114.69 GHVL01030812.1:4018-6207(-)